jgi:type I restriction enzyme M protein
VPDGVLFGSSKAHQSIRKEIVENHQLRAVISMPSGVFKPYAGVSTAVLVFTKTGAGCTDKVWFYDMQADGFSLDDKRTEIKDNDIPDIIARFRSIQENVGDDAHIVPRADEGIRPYEYDEANNPRTAKSFLVPKSEIVENGYDLSINKYKKSEYIAVEYPPTSELLDELDELERQITEGLKDLRGML